MLHINTTFNDKLEKQTSKKVQNNNNVKMPTKRSRQSHCGIVGNETADILANEGS